MKDRSRYRNCYLLFFAILFTLVDITFLAGEYQTQVTFAILIVVFLALVAVPFILFSNGIHMLRKEGRSVANILSLALGLTVGIGELATFAVILIPALAGNEHKLHVLFSRISYISLFISVTVIYFSLAILIFMIYSLFLQIVPRKKNFDFLIIHGAGLLQGRRVSKLLADRLDKAIDVYHKDPTPTIMIPSGGKGGDEEISEAEAMAAYLIENGIPEDRIILEDQSATTMENLVNSKAIIDSMEGNKYTALVTSNYHVYRALRYCRKVGLKCTGIGSHVALYYWPSALIREFIAIHAEKKHFLYLAAGWLVCILPFIIDWIAQ